MSIPTITSSTRAGHESDRSMIRHLTKFCTYCQKNARSSGRFKFTLREDFDFHYSIVVDIMYIESLPLLHIDDEASSFQAASWLKILSARHT